MDKILYAFGAFMGVILFLLVICVAIAVIDALALMKIFDKKYCPGWMAWVPVLRFYKMCEMVGLPTWLAFLTLSPIAVMILSYIPYIGGIIGALSGLITIGVAVLRAVVNFKLAQSFSNDTVLCVLSVIFPMPMHCVFGFGKKYE